MNSGEFRAQAKRAVRKDRRANLHSRRSGVSAFATPSLESIVRECLRHGGWKSDVSRCIHAQQTKEVAVIQTLLETLSCLGLRWIQKMRAHGINRVQLLVTRGEGVAVQNSQVSIVKGMW